MRQVLSRGIFVFAAKIVGKIAPRLFRRTISRTIIKKTTKRQRLNCHCFRASCAKVPDDFALSHDHTPGFALNDIQSVHWHIVGLASCVPISILSKEQ